MPAVIVRNKSLTKNPVAGSEADAADKRVASTSKLGYTSVCIFISGVDFLIPVRDFGLRVVERRIGRRFIL